MKLLTPSGKTLQSKITARLKYIATTRYSENDAEDLRIKEEEIKKGIICMVNRSILV